MHTDPILGDLLTGVQISKGGIPVRLATLREPEVPVRDALLPELYDPVLVLVVPTALRLRGIERVNRRAVVQEWFCEVNGGAAGGGVRT